MSHSIPILETKNLAIGYIQGDLNNILLQNLQLKIYPGDMICLMGVNGRGKTTLLKTLAGLHPPISGQIYLENRLLSSLSLKEVSHLASVVLTDSPDLNHMRVWDVVALGRYPHTGFWGALSESDHDILNGILKLLNIENLKDSFFDTLSDGQKQKVMIGRALAQNTPLIFLDEPTGHLDIHAKMDILQILRNISRQKDIAVFFTSHDFDLALSLSSRIWSIDKAGEIHSGIPEDLILNGPIEKCFSHPSYYFDSARGIFKRKINEEERRFISLRECDDETVRYWTFHALEKEDFFPAPETHQGPLPELWLKKGGHWYLKLDERRAFEGHSVEELVRHLKAYRL